MKKLSFILFLSITVVFACCSKNKNTIKGCVYMGNYTDTMVANCNVDLYQGDVQTAVSPTKTVVSDKYGNYEFTDVRDGLWYLSVLYPTDSLSYCETSGKFNLSKKETKIFDFHIKDCNDIDPY